MKILIGGIILALVLTGVRFIKMLSRMIDEHDEILKSED